MKKQEKKGDQRMKNNLRNKNGITLVVLVITIVLLIVLAGISISVLTQTGVFGKAKQAEQKSKDAQELENLTIADYGNKIDSTVNGSRDTVTISKEEYEKIKNANTYSEEEIKIGTWIDGKTIYRKVVKGISENQSVAFSAEGVISGKNIIDYYGEILARDGNWVNVNYNGHTNLYWDSSTSELKWYITYDYFVDKEYQLVVEYTKTTD